MRFYGGGNKFFSKFNESGFAIKFWDGTKKQYTKNNPKFIIKIKKPISALKLVRNPILELGEAYMDGVIDIEGRFEDVIKWVYLNYDALFASRLPQKIDHTLRKLNLKKGDALLDLSQYMDE